jgi:Concanavalin A-like lectin/glucanases superfamily
MGLVSYLSSRFGLGSVKVWYSILSFSKLSRIVVLYSVSAHHIWRFGESGPGPAPVLEVTVLMRFRHAQIREFELRQSRGFLSFLVTGTFVAMSLVALPASTATAVLAGSASDTSTAAALAKAQGSRVAVDSLETDSSLTYANPDGTFTLEETAQPTRVQRGSTWVPLDTRLVAQPDGSVATAATPATLTLSGGGSSDLVTFSAGSHSLRYGWAGSLPKPTLSGSTATYADVRPNADLQVTATPLGFETFLVLKTRPTQPLGSLQFPISTAGVTARQGPDAALSFDDAAGNQVASADQPQAWDSQVDPHSGEGHRVSIGSSLVAAGAGQDLTLNPLDAFLADPSTVYPVTIDPAATLSRSAFAYIDSAYPTQTYYNNAVAVGEHVGTFNGGGSKNRAMFAFPASSMIGKTILAAHLNTTLNYSWSCTATQVDAHYSNPWGAGVTWNNQPGLSGGYAAVSTAAGYSGSCPAKAVGFDVTALAAAMTNAKWSTYYFSLLAHNESDDYGWKKFANNPNVVVTYNSPPNVPTLPSFTAPVAGCVGFPGPALSNKGPISLRASFTDPDPGNVAGNFYVVNAYNGADVRWHAYLPLAAQGYQSVTVPAGALPDGNYAWNAETSDFVVVSGRSPWCYFVLDSTAPNPPTVGGASDTFDLTNTTRKGDYATPGTVTLGGGGSTDVVKYVYSSVSLASLVNPPACGQSVAGVTSLCPPSMGGTVSASITPTASTNSVWAESIDQAGNISTSVVKTYTVNALKASQARHGWITKTADATAGLTSVADIAGASPALPLSFTSGASWATPNDNGPYFGWPYNGALHLSPPTGGPAGAATAAVAPVPLDDSHSLTVAIWVRPDGTAMASQAALSLDGPAVSGLTVGISAAGQAQACMPVSQVVGATIDCASTTSAIPVGDWTLLVAMWDAIGDPAGHKITLIAHTFNGYVDNAPGGVSIGHTSTGAAAGGLAVGRQISAGGPTNFFSGDVADPMIWDNLLQSSEVDGLFFSLPPVVTG